MKRVGCGDKSTGDTSVVGQARSHSKNEGGVLVRRRRIPQTNRRSRSRLDKPVLRDIVICNDFKTEREVVDGGRERSVGMTGRFRIVNGQNR